MRYSTVTNWLCVLGFTGVLTACGGGGSSSSPAPGPLAVAPTPQIAKGVITGFGSVYVNGVEWETDDCDLSIDDEVGDESQLNVGDIVEIEGSVDANGTANCLTLDYDSEVEGLITEIGADYLLVYGLRIDINDDTVFDEDLPTQSLTDLNVGDYVEVSAFSSADGYIATRIDLEIDDGEIELYGKVLNLDTTTSTFMIYELVVDFSGASFDDFEGKNLEEGDYVEVEGESFGPDGELIAISVEYKDNNPYDDGDEGDEFELEGYLSVAEDGTLTVNDVVIILAERVQFERGSSDDLVDGARIEVEGMLDANGALLVDEVKFKFESEIELKAALDDAPIQDADTGEWTISILGLTLTVIDTTQFEDSSATDETYFDITDLVSGDWLEVKAYKNDMGELVVTRIEREDASDVVEIEAELEAIDGNTLTLLGLDILVDSETQLPDEYADVAGFLDPAQGVQAGTELEIEGIFMDGSIIALSIELDD